MIPWIRQEMPETKYGVGKNYNVNRIVCSMCCTELSRFLRLEPISFDTLYFFSRSMKIAFDKKQESHKTY